MNTLRLQPTRHHTKNAILTILPAGEVCLEFVAQQSLLARITDVCRISANGLRTVLYRPSTATLVSDHPPPLPSKGTDHLYTFDNLPRDHWKEYRYAARFIAMVAVKTPKVTYYSVSAKCQLMESGADFEAIFYDGGKIVNQQMFDFSGEQIGGNFEKWPEFWQNRWRHGEECLEHCKRLKGLNNVRQSPHGAFPLIFGGRPVDFSPRGAKQKENSFNNYLSGAQTPVSVSKLNAGR